MTIKELIEKYKNERLYGDSDDERVSIEILHEISLKNTNFMANDFLIFCIGIS